MKPKDEFQFPNVIKIKPTKTAETEIKPSFAVAAGLTGFASTLKNVNKPGEKDSATMVNPF